MFLGGANLNAEHLSNGRFVVVGESGKIMLSDDQGETWRQVQSGTARHLWSVAFADSLRGVAVGNVSTALRTTDGGETWQRISLPVVPRTLSLSNVILSNDGTGLCGGENGTLLETTDYGASWRIIPTTSVTGDTARITAIARLGRDTVFIVGLQGLFARSINGGATWSSVAMGLTPSSSIWLVSIRFHDSNHGIAAGSSLTLGTGPVVFMTDDGGATWRGGYINGVQSSFNDVNYVSRDTVVSSSNGGGITMSFDGGKTWHHRLIWFPITSADIFRFIPLGKDSGFVFGGNNTIAKATKIFDSLDYSGEDDILYTLDFKSHAVAAADYVFYGNKRWLKTRSNDAYIQITTDRGVTWRTHSYVHFVHLSCFGKTDTTLIVAGSLGGYMQSSDSGRTWQHRQFGYSLPFGDSFSKILFPFPDKPNIGFTASDKSRFYRTTNRGDTWEFVARVIPGREDDLVGLVCIDGIFYVKTNYEFYKSVDTGKTWALASTIEKCSSFDFADSRTGLYCSWTGRIERTTDGGTSWSTVVNNSDYSFYDIKFYNKRIAFATESRGRLFYSSDAGITWVQDTLTLPDTTDIKTDIIAGRVYFPDDTTLLIHGGSIVSLRKNLTSYPFFTPSSVVEGGNDNNPYLNITVTPNPSRFKVTFRVNGLYSVSGERLGLYVYNMQGLLYADLSQELIANNNGSWADVPFESGNLPPGPYIINLRAGRWSKSGKFAIGR